MAEKTDREGKAELDKHYIDYSPDTPVEIRKSIRNTEFGKAMRFRAIEERGERCELSGLTKKEAQEIHLSIGDNRLLDSGFRSYQGNGAIQLHHKWCDKYNDPNLDNYILVGRSIHLIWLHRPAFCELEKLKLEPKYWTTFAYFGQLIPPEKK